MDQDQRGALTIGGAQIARFRIDEQIAAFKCIIWVIRIARAICLCVVGKCDRIGSGRIVCLNKVYVNDRGNIIHSKKRKSSLLRIECRIAIGVLARSVVR